MGSDDATGRRGKAAADVAQGSRHSGLNHVVAGFLLVDQLPRMRATFSLTSFSLDSSRSLSRADRRQPFRLIVLESGTLGLAFDSIVLADEFQDRPFARITQTGRRQPQHASVAAGPIDVSLGDGVEQNPGSFLVADQLNHATSCGDDRSAGGDPLLPIVTLTPFLPRIGASFGRRLKLSCFLGGRQGSSWRW